MSCYENKKYYEKRGLPRNIQFQIVRMLKVKEFTVEELSLMLNYPAEIIQKTLDTMIKSGLISIEDKEVKP
jgi:predicted transcriptional regulator